MIGFFNGSVVPAARLRPCRTFLPCPQSHVLRVPPLLQLCLTSPLDALRVSAFPVNSWSLTAVTVTRLRPLFHRCLLLHPTTTRRTSLYGWVRGRVAATHAFAPPPPPPPFPPPPVTPLTLLLYLPKPQFTVAPSLKPPPRSTFASLPPPTAPSSGNSSDIHLLWLQNLLRSTLLHHLSNADPQLDHSFSPHSEFGHPRLTRFFEMPLDRYVNVVTAMVNDGRFSHIGHGVLRLEGQTVWEYV